ncbi:MAG: DUF4105 domain-containing protein [Castellaniella sp.]|uniref:Lnb N-terminal periplasmic domain-containing protein n=1 Tax=Castellaniella sp. TaxID=1955812 RepID=UPI00122BA665|nr:DUF4105 domain-containing protein [Castellaniella sp.]TAN27173.1 MAG: DUF4105 domain-containing protein [Castellaniella sp.]
MTTAIAVAAIMLWAGWGACALWFRLPFNRRVNTVIIAAWLGLTLLGAAGLISGETRWTDPFGAASLMLLAWWWLGVRPSNDRDWMPEVARLTHGDVAGNIVTLYNVRDFRWRTQDDYDVRWRTCRYDLDRLESVDLVLSTWGNPAVAHAMVSFGFGAGSFVIFSVEIRRKRGDVFSEIGGFFRKYELSVLASTEEDSLRVRTNVRGEKGYLYRIDIPLDGARALFVSYVRTASRLRQRPRFYNTLTANCTTLIWRLANQIIPGLPMDYRLLLSGYLPEYLDCLGGLAGEGDVASRRRAGNYTSRALAAPDAADYSRVIREGVPGIPPPDDRLR